MKPALLVIDMQNKWLEPSKKIYPDRCVVVNNINEQLRMFRSKKWPVFVFTIEHEADGSTLSSHDKAVWNVSGTEEAKIVEELELQPEDRFIIKRRYSCFHGTDFLKTAKAEGVSHILICGYQLSACVLDTALDAYQFEFRPFVLSDCVLDTEKREFDYFTEYFDRANCLISSKDWTSKAAK